MVAIALVTDRSDRDRPAQRRRSEDALAAALTARGATLEVARWDEVDGTALEVDLVVIREVHLDPVRRETFLGWARATAETVPVCNPVEVLRWGSHRSFLLELEERGAPLVPTAWLARGDTVDLHALLRARGWAGSRIVPGVAGGDRDQATVGAGACGVAAGQGALDRILATDDALVQELPSVRDTTTTRCLVVDGRTSHLVRTGRGSGQVEVEDVEVEDVEAAALAEWVVAATGVDLLFARVDLVQDEVGTWQLADLDAVAPDLALGVSPNAASLAADAILRRLG